MIFFHSPQVNCEPPPEPPGGMNEATVVVSFKKSLAGQTNLLTCIAFAWHIEPSILILLHTTT